ncbi:hypothetical protein HJV68_01120 [Intestinimonas butyriciproducens]|nr:hypothetical protein [Intestinimonas butyriciproducens]DAK74698.1 MAG TPA: hypothetical protein [Caudoviricetes sp.]
MTQTSDLVHDYGSRLCDYPARRSATMVHDYPGHLCDYAEAADLSSWEIGGSFAPWPEPGPFLPWLIWCSRGRLSEKVYFSLLFYKV